ncbi:MAG TPA: hypothetical protein VN635_12175 [Conexibacter sp.]|nr:hypothetical protein [Conexibacter sp.]
MSVRSRFIISALVVTMLLAGAVGSASARELLVSEQHHSWIWLLGHALLHPRIVFSNGQIRVQCNLRLGGGTNERIIKKETTTTIGSITNGEVEECEGGTATLRRETLPWSTRYRSFTGTLPRIRSSSESVIRATFRIREREGLECEAATEVNHPLVFIIGNSSEQAETGLETTGEAEYITADSTHRIPLRGEGFLCAFAGEGEISGVGLVRNLPGTGKIRITLI